MFELRFNASLARIAASMSAPLPKLTIRLLDDLKSGLLSENLSPSAYSISMLLDSFVELLRFSQKGEPFIYKKRHSLTLLFDVFSVQSEMSVSAPDDLILGYTQTMMGFLLFNADPKQIGMIGLGGGSLAKFCYRNLPGAVVSVAEIDEKVIALRDYFCIPKDDARMAVHCMDGADFVRQADNCFDVLIIDGFDKNGQPAQLCSQHFYDDCYQSLNPGGILVVNLLGGVADLRIYLDRLNRSFLDAMFVIDALDSRNKIAFAYKGDMLNLDDGSLQQRVAQLEKMHPLILSTTAQNLSQALRAASS